ncbi:MAG: PEP-CTERM sorting domain-containing protein [Phycisphaeraceae bacterium]|nr:PEP-CTERM sorting domain-containing protein [Phycisphaeraceae bacterium]
MLQTTARNLITASLLAAALPAAAQQAGDDPVKIYLMMGQSNMEGWGNWYENDGVTQHPTLIDPTDPYPLTQLDVDGYTAPLDQVWVNHPEGDKAAGPLAPGFGAGVSNGTHIGIELSMGHQLAANNTNQFYFFKSDKGGTSLFSDWRPPSAVANRGGDVGDQYTRAIKGFHNLLNNFDTMYPEYDGAGYEIAGMVWLQGWNDYNANGAPEYEQNLTDLVADVRHDLGLADLPVIISDAPRDTTLPLHEQVATAKQNVVNALNTAQPGSAVYVNSLGIDPVSGEAFFHWNFTASNYIEMGKRNATGAQSVMRSGSVNHEGNSDVAAAWDRFRDSYSRIVRYEMDEAGGTTVFNTAGAGSVADAVLTNTAARTPGIGLATSSGAIDAGDGVIRATNDFGNLNQTYTLGAWVKLDDLADTQGRYTILSTEDSDGSGSDTGWNFGVERKQVGGEWVNYLYFDLRHRNGMNSLNDSDDGTDLVLEADREYFVAFARDVTLGSGEDDNSLFYLYDVLTGELIASNGGSSENQKATTFKNIRVGVGVDDYDVEQAGTMFQGLIDDAQIWDLTLSESDILGLAQQGSLFVVPEPTSLLLLGAGGLLLVRRR